MMRKLIVTSFFFILINQPLISQDKGFGIKGGITTTYFSTNSNNGSFDLDFNTGIGFNAGVFADIFRKENFIVSAELYFNRKIASSEISSSIITSALGEFDIAIDYLEYGVPFKYNLTKSSFIPFIFLEPRVSFYLGSDLSNSKDSIAQSVKNIIKEDFTKFGFGLSAGIGSEIQLKKGMSLLFEIQFSSDFFDTYFSEDFAVKSNSLEFRTGVRFY